LLEQGFTGTPLSWLTPSLGTVESLTPINAEPINLHEEMCGPHRKRPAAEEEEQEANAPADSPYAVFLSSLRPQAKGSLLQTEINLGQPVVVFTGPPRGQGLTQVASADAKPAKPIKPAAAKSAAPKPDPTVTPAGSPAVAAASVVPWTSLSPAALAASPPSELRATPIRTSAVVPLPRARPRVPVEKPDRSQIPSP